VVPFAQTPLENILKVVICPKTIIARCISLMIWFHLQIYRSGDPFFFLDLPLYHLSSHQCSTPDPTPPCRLVIHRLSWDRCLTLSLIFIASPERQVQGICTWLSGRRCGEFCDVELGRSGRTMMWMSHIYRNRLRPALCCCLRFNSIVTLSYNGRNGSQDSGKSLNRCHGLK
jgi:hypothetical protein